MTEKRKPTLIVDNSHWSRDGYVVFADENITDLIPEEWIDENYQDALETDEMDVTRDNIVSQMKNSFFSENSRVIEFNDDYLIDHSGNVYKYNTHGQIKFCGNYTSLNEYLQAEG